MASWAYDGDEQAIRAIRRAAGCERLLCLRCRRALIVRERCEPSDEVVAVGEPVPAVVRIAAAKAEWAGRGVKSSRRSPKLSSGFDGSEPMSRSW